VAPDNNEMNQTNRGVPGMKERRPSGEPALAEVGPPVILSLGVAGYLSVRRTQGNGRHPALLKETARGFLVVRSRHLAG
jgi:hypothetical protein